jgi:hypothetical protein
MSGNLDARRHVHIRVKGARLARRENICGGPAARSGTRGVGLLRAGQYDHRLRSRNEIVGDTSARRNFRRTPRAYALFGCKAMTGKTISCPHRYRLTDEAAIR